MVTKQKKEDSSTLQTFDAADFSTTSNRHDYLGRGGFAAVRRCKHPKLKWVVVKCFMITGTPRQCDRVLQEISREAKALSHLDHKNIVKVYGLTAWQQGIYQGIVMEFMEGGNLSSLIFMKVVKNIPWKLRLRFCLEIAEGLEYLHYNGRSTVFIHGDMKPENILLTADLEVKIADFGAVTIAQATGASHASIELSSTKQHTVVYAAPEFLRKPTSERTRAMDIYSTAMIFYEILTRCRVFGGVHPAVFHEKLLSEEGLKPDEELIKYAKSEVEDCLDDLYIFNMLEAIMKQCWDLDPAKRLSALEVYDQLSNEKGSLTNMDSLIENVKLQRQGFPLHFTKLPCYEDTSNQLDEQRKNHLDEFYDPFVSCDAQITSIPSSTLVPASRTEKTLVNESYAPLVAGALSQKSKNRRAQILVIGNKHVGKSCLINRFFNQVFTKLPVTPGLVCENGTFTMGDGDRTDVLLWDVGGNFGHLLAAVDQSNLCAIMYAYDITNKESFDAVTRWLSDVNKYRKKPIIQMLIGNKCDQAEKREVRRSDGKDFAESNGMLFYETSAKADTNIQAAFNDLLVAVKKKEIEENRNAAEPITIDSQNRQLLVLRNKDGSCQC